jgi:hypothetical protein
VPLFTLLSSGRDSYALAEHRQYKDILKKDKESDNGILKEGGGRH